MIVFVVTFQTLFRTLCKAIADRAPDVRYIECLVVVSLLAGVASSKGASADGDDELNSVITYGTAFFPGVPELGDDRPQISTLELETEFFLDLSDRFTFTARPYIQYEHLSESDRHQDLREFYLGYTADSWELRLGLARVFWGVAEGRNVVDVINQNDLASDFSGDAKLGQPMVDITWFSDFGDFSFFYLPRFREPQFPGADSRPRTGFVVNEELTEYESPDGDQNRDFALRWSNSIDIYDVGLHYFDGTRRQPDIIGRSANGLALRYKLVQQAGVDVQATIGALLAKLELLRQTGDEITDHSEMAVGTEYSFSQVFSSDIDIGVLTEYLYDTRQRTAEHAFQDDVLVGLRFVFNDESSTEGLAIAIFDTDTDAKFYQLKFERRIARNLKVNLQGNWWRDVADDAILEVFQDEDNVQMTLEWYF
ncbi:MAG: hypothetical protein AB8B63_02470 [Granulosicoccus sp.]